MKDGFIQQVGTPTEVFDMPINLFVAEFIGAPKMNTFKCDLILEDGKYYVTPYGAKIEITGKKAQMLKEKNVQSQEIVLGVRPENIEAGGEDLKVNVFSNENLGMNTLVHGYLGGNAQAITCKLRGWCDYKRGDEVNVQFVKRHFFDKETTNAIR